MYVDKLECFMKKLLCYKILMLFGLVLIFIGDWEK